MTTTEIKSYVNRVLRRHPLWGVYCWTWHARHIECCKSAEYNFPTPRDRTYCAGLPQTLDAVPDHVRDDYCCAVIENAMASIIDRIEQEWNETER